VGPPAGLDGAKNLTPTGIRSPHRSALSERLYVLRYPASKIEYIRNRNKSYEHDDYKNDGK
jgi:hypothetical protein